MSARELARWARIHTANRLVNPSPVTWLRRYLGAAPALGFEHTATREAYVSWWHPHGWWDHYLSMRGTRA